MRNGLGHIANYKLTSEIPYIDIEPFIKEQSPEIIIREEKIEID